MGVAVLYPQDCLRSPLSRPSIPRRNPNPNRSNRRKRGPSRLRSPARSPVAGQVRILKRGEDVGEMEAHALHARSSVPDFFNEKALAGSSMKRADPIRRYAVGMTRIRFPDFYAGSAFISSPPPGDLPLPAFVFARNGDASSGLRRILGLEKP